MMVPRRLLLDPECNTLYAAPAVALSMVVFAYSGIFGQISVLAFYAVWLPVLLLAPRLLLANWQALLPILALPMLAVLSVLWSDAPNTTLRAGIQFASTVLCGLVAARLVAVPVLVLGGLFGSFFILLYSFVEGRYVYDVVDASFAFAGVFGSKNQLGYFASLALVFAIAALVVFRTMLIWRLFALVVFAMAAAALVLSDSATSVLTLLVALATLAVARLLFTMTPRQRRIALGITGFATMAGVLLAMLAGAFGGLLALFGRDATLTGRTYLWTFGIEFGSERPLFGLGYYAFWVHGRPEAERLWEEFYIDTRAGFNFHNALAEAFVGLGLIGLCVLGVWLALLLLRSGQVLLTRRFAGSAMISAGLAVLFLVRAMVEIDFLQPYAAGSFLVPYLLLRMADQRAEERALKRAPPGPVAAQARGNQPGAVPPQGRPALRPGMAIRAGTRTPR